VGYGLDDWGSISNRGRDLSSLSMCPRPAQGPTSLLFNVYRKFFPQGGEAYHSPTSSAKGTIPLLPHFFRA